MSRVTNTIHRRKRIILLEKVVKDNSPHSEFITMDDGEGSENNRPKDMNALLKFCLETTKNEDPAQGSAFREMSQERKEWLSNALKELSVNPVERLQKCIESVKELGTCSPLELMEGVSAAIGSLEELRDWCEEIDLAVDFHKVGGFFIFPIVLQHPDSEIRWRGLDLVAALVQNNPYCQNAFLEGGFLPETLSILDKDLDPTTRTKALYAISCLVRTSEAAQVEFVKNNGFSILLRAMQSDVEKLKVKASFLLTSICNANTKYKDTLCAMGIVEQLLSHLMEDHQQEHEHIMAALLCLARDHPPTQAQCRRPELNLQAVLQQRIKAIAGKDEHMEEAEYAQELLQIISEDGEEEGQR